MNTSNLIEQEMLYNIQLSRISANAFPEKFKSTRSSISRPTQDMIDDYNEQFKRPFEREVVESDGTLVKKQFKYDVPNLEDVENGLADIDAEEMDLESRRRVKKTEFDDSELFLERYTKDYEDLNAEFLGNNEEIKRLEKEYNQISNDKDTFNKDTKNKGKKKASANNNFDRKMALKRNEIIAIKDRNIIVKRDIRNIEGEINHYSGQQDIYNKETSNIQAMKSKLKKDNYDKLKAYTDELNLLNNGAFSMEQRPNESDDEYLQRIKNTGQIAYDDDVNEGRAALDNMNKFKHNMLEILRTEWKIENVLKSFKIEDIAKLNKVFPHFKAQILKTYGFNNNNVSVEDYKEAIQSYLGHGELPEKVALEHIKEEETKIKAVGETSEEFDQTLTEFTTIVNNIQFATDSNTLLLCNKFNDALLYLKISDVHGRKLILFSKTGKKGTFQNISFDHRNPPNRFIVVFRDYFGMSDEEIAYLFKGQMRAGGQHIPKLENIYRALKAQFGLIALNIDKLSQTKTHDSTTFGWGVKNKETLPTYCNFGKILIMLDKLYYKNELSVKHKNKVNIQGFNNAKVSDNFVALVMKICRGGEVSKVDVKNLTNIDKEVWDMLLHVSGLYKSDYDNTKQQSVNKLKARLELVVGEIEAGNNNTDLNKELYELLFKLVNLGGLTISAARNYYKSIVKEYFK